VFDQIRNSSFSKLLLGGLALFLLNTSIDTVDPYPEYIAEDLSYNDQESIVELVLETFLGFEDAIAEYDDHDNDDQTKKKHTSIEVIALPDVLQRSAFLNVLIEKQVLRSFNALTLLGYREVSSPPPEV
jgi:hypothetical protein